MTDTNPQPTAATTAAATNYTAKHILETLRQQRQAWESNELKASNEALYAVLAQCVRFYEQMATDTDLGRQLRRELDEQAAERKIRFASTTHTIVRIVRLVFEAADSKKASAYGVALRVAIANGVTHEGVPAYIRENGGLENLRKQEVRPPTETASQKAEQAWNTLKDTTLAEVSSQGLRGVTDLATLDSPVVLLATHRKEGIYRIHAVLIADSVVNAAYATQSKTAQGKSSEGSGNANLNSVDAMAAVRERAVSATIAA